MELPFCHLQSWDFPHIFQSTETLSIKKPYASQKQKNNEHTYEINLKFTFPPMLLVNDFH